MNDEKLLSYIYKSSKSGSQTLNTLLSQVDNPAMRQDILSGIYAYDAISTDAAEIMAKGGTSPKENGIIKQAMSAFGTKLNTAFDASPAHIAQMIIKNSQSEVRGISKELERFCDCTPEVHALGRKLLRSEETNLEAMKSYL